MSTGEVWLIPSLLAEDATECIPAYILPRVLQCQVLFVENERTARRFLKKLSREIVIDNFEWHTIHKTEPTVIKSFQDALKQGKHVGIISEAGCPGVADPGQILVAAAQDISAKVNPLVGPNSILLALMASGLNGQQFRFHGYLPIDQFERKNKIKQLEQESIQQNTTQIFIETPYRNNQLLQDLVQQLSPNTRICVAVNLTHPTEEIILTKSAKDWKKEKADFHKKPAIFLMGVQLT